MVAGFSTLRSGEFLQVRLPCCRRTSACGVLPPRNRGHRHASEEFDEVLAGSAVTRGASCVLSHEHERQAREVGLEAADRVACGGRAVEDVLRYDDDCECDVLLADDRALKPHRLVAPIDPFVASATHTDNRAAFPFRHL